MKAHYGDIGIINIIRQRLKDIELQRWLFKTTDNYKCEDYLHQVTNTRHRIALTKLRLSNHKLAIETGRYSIFFFKTVQETCRKNLPNL